MKPYQTLLFDVDDTLLDFGAAEKAALRKLLEDLGLPFNRDVFTRYQSINQGLWRSFEEGKLSRDEVIHTRFSLFLRTYEMDVDGAAMERRYRRYLEEGHQLVDGAMELIAALHRQFDLYIVTNGVSRTQHKRLHDSGLSPYFKQIFVSEDTGYQKPMPEFFAYVFARIPQFTAERALVIGDSLTADIKGGQQAGLDTCWFNPKGKQNENGIAPTYEIRQLAELFGILGVHQRLSSPESSSFSS